VAHQFGGAFGYFRAVRGDHKPNHYALSNVRAAASSNKYDEWAPGSM
jgi:hypothetical protein